MKIELPTQKHLLETPRTVEQAQRKASDIHEALIGQGYTPQNHPAFSHAKRELEELQAIAPADTDGNRPATARIEAELDRAELERLKKIGTNLAEIVGAITPEERRRADLHTRALIAQYRKSSPAPVENTLAATTDSKPGVAVTVNHRDEVLIDADLGDRSL